MRRVPAGSILATGFVLGVFFGAALWGDDLTARLEGSLLRISAPNFRFFTPRATQHLRNGILVPFDFQLTVHGDGRTFARLTERCVASFDLWEERYAVALPALAEGRMVARERSVNLTPEQAQRWCVERLGVPVAGLPRDRMLRIRLEVRAPEPKPAAAPSPEPGISLAALVDLFSRPARPQQERWMIETAPFRLDSLR